MRSIKSSILDIILNGNNLVAMITMIPVAMWTYDLGLPFMFPFRMARAKPFLPTPYFFWNLRDRTLFSLWIQREKKPNSFFF